MAPESGEVEASTSGVSMDEFKKLETSMGAQMEELRSITSREKDIGGAPKWPMRGAYWMRHRCHAISNKICVAHIEMCHA